jgi:threonine dehydratase
MQPPSLQLVEAACHRIAGLALRTPLVRLAHPGATAIYLKLENLQPVGSFKVRGAANAILSSGESAWPAGVVTASAGNFAQGLGFVGRHLGIRTTALVPDKAARSKLRALEELGVTIERLPFVQWWDLVRDPAAYESMEGFIHPAANAAVMAGNGTIALEILEEIHPSCVLVPYGGGGLAVGIAAALAAKGCAARVLGVESTAGTPLAAAWAAGRPVEVSFNAPTFVAGIGSSQVLPVMWPLVRQLLDGAVSASPASIAAAIRLLVEQHHVVAEGAGAAAVAVALGGGLGSGPVVCIVSGGHLDSEDLEAILRGAVPG